MKFKYIVPVMLTALMLCTSAHAATDAVDDNLVKKSDTRRTDDYTSLSYGAITTDLMISQSTSVRVSGGIEVGIPALAMDAEVDFREDAIDGACGDGGAEIGIGIWIDRCGEIKLAAKLSETSATELWSTSDVPDYIYIQVITQNGRVSTYINNELVNTVAAGERIALPKLYFTEAYCGIDDVSCTPISAAEAVNAAEDSDIEATIKGIVVQSGKFDYTLLPICDRNAISAEILAGIPYTSDSAFFEAYADALESAVTAGGDGYELLWKEDFSNFSTAKWSEIGSLHSRAIGDEKIFSDLDRKSINIRDEKASAGFLGASHVGGDLNYIKRDVSSANSIVTCYFYDVMNDNVAAYYTIGINGKTWIGRSDGTDFYTYAAGGEPTWTGVRKSAMWHKVEFDGISEPGTTKMYLDGTLVGTSSEPIEYVQIGNPWIENNYNVVYMDCVSVAIPETKKEKLVIKNGNTEITDGKLPSTGNVTVAVENSKFENEYVIAAYKNKKLVSLTVLTKAQQAGGVLSQTVGTDGADMLKVFKWDGINSMNSMCKSTILTK